MLCDSVESVRWGLIHMGSFTNYHSLNPMPREHMCATERANLIASRTMGTQRYLNTIRSHNQGTVFDGDGTDMGQEGAEPESPELDPVINPSEGDLTTIAYHSSDLPERIE